MVDTLPLPVSPPLSVRLALIALAYGGGPEAFWDPGRIWTEDHSTNPAWNACVWLAQCISISRDAAASCIEMAWLKLLAVDWVLISSADPPIPLFGLTLLASVAGIRLLGAVDPCDDDQSLRLMRAEANDRLKWSHASVGTSQRPLRRALLWHAALTAVQQDLDLHDQVTDWNRSSVLPSVEKHSHCMYHRRAGFFALAFAGIFEYKDKDTGFMYLSGVQESFIAYEHSRDHHDSTRGVGDALRMDSPVWSFLRGEEIYKFRMSPALIGEILQSFKSTSWSEGGLTMLEAGAHEGDDTVRFCLALPHLEVYAFEPLPESFARLKHRIETNASECLGRVHFNQIGLASRETQTQMHIVKHGESFGASSFFQRAPQTLQHYTHFEIDGSSVTVQALSLDAAVESAGLEQVDFLRLDMEGAELHVLQASSQVLMRARVVQVEVHPDGTFMDSGPTSLEAFREFLEPLGWRLLWTTVGVDRPEGTGDAIFVRL